ncbi:MAG: hypothetical protein HQM06_03220 [Magnetococcales bacterium]|nr:hypothetical protein [Magnetococcales bacterium]
MPPWILAVANLALLLLIIFVGFLSASRIDASRSGMMVASIQRALGVQGAAPAQPLGEAVDDPIGFPQKIALLHQITPLVDRRQADVETTKEGFFMSMELDTVFVPGTVLIRPEIRHRLRSMASLLASLENLIHVTGFVDSASAAASSASSKGGTSQSDARASRSAGSMTLSTHLQQSSAFTVPVAAASNTPAANSQATEGSNAQAPAAAAKGSDKSQAAALLSSNPSLAYAVSIADYLVAEGTIPAWRIRTEGKPVSGNTGTDNKSNVTPEAQPVKNSNLGHSRRIEIRIARETLSAEVASPKAKTENKTEGKH